MKNPRRLLSVFFFVLLVLPSFAQTSIEMEEDNGIYKVPCKVNGLKLKFVFDTGASSVSISSAIANMMFENGYLSEEDILGLGKTQIANGDIINNTVINIKEVEIGGMIMNDVQAVVIHQQSAPLLLGQSAIQKLGKVSIMGNMLIIDQLSIQNPYKEKRQKLDTDELKVELSKAYEYRERENYLAAVEIYDRIFESGQFSDWEIDSEIVDIMISYADCLSTIDRDREAMSLCMYIEEWIEQYTPSFLPHLYMRIYSSAYDSKEYNLAIKYAMLCQSKITITNTLYHHTIYCIAMSFREQGKKYDAKYVYRSYINKYLEFMEIALLDCWDKNYRDEKLADALYEMSLIDFNENEKYKIIAAAWGNSEAREHCNKYDIDYLSKPQKYEYKF